MKIIRPITIDASNLTSSVPEVAPVAYNSGTTYDAGAQVSITTGLVSSVYQSLAGSNTGNAPASSPTWWALVSETYAEYSSGATYAAGDKVIDATAHRAYQSLADGNTGNPLTDAASWLDLGPTNRYAMFDQSNGTTTASGYGIDVTVQTDSRTDGLALLNVDAETVRVSCAVTSTPRTNSLPYSQELDNADYLKDAAIVTANSGLAPDGTMTADLVQITNRIWFYDNSNVTGTKTFSIYVKPEAGSSFSMTAVGGQSVLGGNTVTADLSSGTISSGHSAADATIADVGSGWFRLSIVSAVTVAAGNATYWNIEATTGAYVWGLQIETGSSATAYIATGSTAVTTLWATVYDKTYSLLSDSGITSWYDWFTEEIVYETDLILTDLPKNSDMAVRVQITSAAGDVSVGAMVLGQQLDIGNVVYGARTGIQDYSRKEADEFGNYNIVQRNFAKRAAFKLVLDNSRIDTVQRVLAQYRAIPVVWIGADDYSSTWLFGFFKDFAVEITMIEKSYLTLEIEGLT